MSLTRPDGIPWAHSPCLLLAGQSNADGRDGVPSNPLTGRIVIVGTGRGNWGANASVDELANEIAVLKVAYGGKSMVDWLDVHQPELFGDVATFGYTPTELVWIQGEREASDADLAAACQANWDLLIDRFIAEYPTLEVVYVALLSSGLVDSPYKATVNGVYTATAAARTELRWHLIDTDGYELQVDGTHYTRAGYDAMRADISALRATELPTWAEWLTAAPRAAARLSAGEAAGWTLAELAGPTFRRRDALTLRRAAIAAAGGSTALRTYAQTTPTAPGEAAFQWTGTRPVYRWDP